MNKKPVLVATGESSAGHWMEASGEDKEVHALVNELVCWPVPALDDPREFHTARAALCGPELEAWQREEWLTNADTDWRELLARCADSERLELSADPEPEAQLQMLQVLDALHRGPAPGGAVFLLQASVKVGGQNPGTVAPDFAPVDQAMLTAASRVWRALCEPSPQAWRHLLDEADTLNAFPYLRSAMLALLDELPDARSGLSACQRQLLGLVAEREGWRAIEILALQSARSIVDYWEAGRQLMALGPALQGLPAGETFGMEMHDDEDRHRRFTESRLSLTPLGRALLAGADDFARHARIRRWWGGTQLTNERLWRWNVAAQRLLPP